MRCTVGRRNALQEARKQIVLGRQRGITWDAGAPEEGGGSDGGDSAGPDAKPNRPPLGAAEAPDAATPDAEPMPKL